jgi:hypothetical protein
MSKQIVATKDKEYAYYAGADLDTAQKMALIDTFIKNGLIPDYMMPMAKLYRDYLNQNRKAFFASIGSSEITKLGFILGIQDDTIRASDPEE